MRHTLTDEQFLAYIDVERKAQQEDRIVSALGSQAGVADVLAGMFGAKGTKPGAMNAYIKSIGAEAGDAATAGDSREMGELRRRIKALVDLGEM